MRFFEHAQRPAGGRRIAAVAAAVAVAAVVLAGDAQSPEWPAVIDTAAILGPGPGPVASGNIQNVPWQIFFRPSNQIGQSSGAMCIFAVLGDSVPGTCGTFPPPGWGPVHPAWFYASWLESPQLQVQFALGGVDADVTSVLLRMRDGQQLKLVPVSRYGYRLVAFVIPIQVRIAAVTAYLDNGRYATSIPSYSKDGVALFNSWVWHSPGPLSPTT